MASYGSHLSHLFNIFPNSITQTAQERPVIIHKHRIHSALKPARTGHCIVSLTTGLKKCLKKWKNRMSCSQNLHPGNGAHYTIQVGSSVQQQQQQQQTNVVSRFTCNITMHTSNVDTMNYMTCNKQRHYFVGQCRFQNTWKRIFEACYKWP